MAERFGKEVRAARGAVTVPRKARVVARSMAMVEAGGLCAASLRWVPVRMAVLWGFLAAHLSVLLPWPGMRSFVVDPETRGGKDSSLCTYI